MSTPINEEFQAKLSDIQDELETVKNDTSNCSSTRKRVLILTDAVRVLARSIKLSPEDQKQFDDYIRQL